MSIKYWWSADRQWFCVLVDNGVSRATVSLTPEEADRLANEAIRTPDYLVMEAKCRRNTQRILDEARDASPFPPALSHPIENKGSGQS